MKNLITTLLILCSFSAFAQTTAADSIAMNNCETGGNAMAKTLFEKKYDSFIKYTYPPLVKMGGGPVNLVKAVKKGIDDMEAQGYSFTSVSVDRPLKVVHFNKVLQCVVIENIEMKVPNGRVTSRSAMIAVSNDNGKNWTFIDTHGTDLKTLQKTIPGLSAKLEIPEKEKPLYYKN